MKKIVAAMTILLILVSTPSLANAMWGWWRLIPIVKNVHWAQKLRDIATAIPILEAILRDDEGVEKILAKLEETEKKLEEIEKILDSASDDRREIEILKEKMKDTLDGISTRVEIIIQKTGRMESAIRNVKDSLYALADSLDIDLVHIARDFEDIHKAIAKLDSRVAQLDQRVDSLIVVLVNLKSRVGTLEGRVDSLEGRVGDLERRVDNLEGRVRGLEGRVDNLEGRVRGLEGRVDNLEGRLDSLESRVSLLEVKLRALEDHVYCRECFSPVSFGAFLSHWYSNQDNIRSKPAFGGALLLNFSNRIGIWGEYSALTITMKNTAETIEWNNHIFSAGVYYSWQPYEQWPFTFKVRSGVGVLAGSKNSDQIASGVSNGSSKGGLLRGEVIFGRYSTKSQFELYGNATLVILHERLELKSTDISKNLDRYFLNFSIGARIHFFGFN